MVLSSPVAETRMELLDCLKQTLRYKPDKKYYSHLLPAPYVKTKRQYERLSRFG